MKVEEQEHLFSFKLTRKFSGWILAVISGLFVFLLFPNFNLFFLSWISIIPLLISISLSSSYLLSFLYGLLCGVVAYCGILYWIVPTLRASGEPFLLSIFILFLLALYIAFYVGVFVLLYAFVRKRLGPMLTPFWAASFWVSLELMRSHFLTGFPWALLGYSQATFLPLIQIASIGGVYALSFVIILANSSLAEFFLEWRRGMRSPGILIPPFLVLLLCLLWGFLSIRKLNQESLAPEDRRINTTILQGNIDQYMKWDNTYKRLIIERYTELVQGTKNTDLMIWPETAVPGYLPFEQDLLLWVEDLARKSQCWHLIGTPRWKDGKAYNSLLLLSPIGTVSFYDKVHLVPFGEYVPFRRYLSPWIKVVNELGDFTPGTKLLPLFTPLGNFAANICYESIFPHLVRKQVLWNADYIVNITNDAWYLRTSAPAQHFLMNVFRAVEN